MGYPRVSSYHDNASSGPRHLFKHVLPHHLHELDRERGKQIKKFGPQTANATLYYLAILMEEVGELAKEIVDQKGQGTITKEMREELVQVATVSVAWLAAMDFNTENKFAPKSK